MCINVCVHSTVYCTANWSNWEMSVRQTVSHMILITTQNAQLVWICTNPPDKMVS